MRESWSNLIVHNSKDNVAGIEVREKTIIL